jgi:hypothetical protein
VWLQNVSLILRALVTIKHINYTNNNYVIHKAPWKNPQHAFLRRRSKAVCPMSCFTACKRTQKWRGSHHFRQNSLGHFSPIVPPSAAGFTSVASDAGSLLWRKLERSKSLVLLQVGGLMCRCQRHSVKPSCWECSTMVEQAETQLRVVVPIEEEDKAPCSKLFWNVICLTILQSKLI